MKRKLTFTLALALATASLFAQSDYKQSIGARISPASNYDLFAVSYKTFLAEQPALEFNIGFGGSRYGYLLDNYRSTTLSASAAYQHHFAIKPVPGLKWYVGGGLTVFHSSSKYDGYKGVSVGVFPTGGADYKFEKIPLAVSADWRPTFLVAKTDQYNGFYGDGFGISARYTF